MMQAIKILIVEDDSNLAFLLSEHLSAADMESVVCSNGTKALDKIKSEKIHLCLLDVVLPDIDGVTLAGKVKEYNKDLPIIFLTSRNLKSDMQSGYAAGCDDYITKPFDADLLILKIKAVLKRYSKEEEQTAVIAAGPYQLNVVERRLTTAVESIKLSGKEADILAELFKHTDKPISREKLMMEVWGRSDYFISKNLDVFMTRIRKILKQHTDMNLETIHAFGFVLREGSEMTE